MPVQDVRVIEMPVRGDVSGLEGDKAQAAPMRPVAVDAVRWGATLMTQLGLDPRRAA